MKFNISTTNGLIKVDGRNVSLAPYPEYRFFSHKSLEHPKFFVVSEYKTGRRISHEHLRRQDAIDDAIAQIQQYGIHKIDSAIEDCVSKGLMVNGTDNEL